MLRFEPIPATPEEARTNLRDTIERLGETMAAMSRLIGRRNGYIACYINEGAPKVLLDRDRDLLAKYLGIDARLLGAPDPE